MILQQALLTPDLELRTLQPAACEHSGYLRWLQDPEVLQYLELRLSPPASWESLAAFVQQCNDSDDTLLLGMFVPDSGQHVGNIKLGPIHPYHRCADIGLLVGERSQWGRGLASQAIIALSDYAFQTLGLAKLTAGCYAGNVGSLKAFLRAGFQQEGCLRQQWKTELGREDGILLGRVNPNMIEREGA